MKREILFRGKLDQIEQWVYGDLLYEYGDVNKPLIHSIVCGEPQFDIVITETVGQFTGLEDKNGKKIFEGDILCSEYLEGTKHQLRAVMNWEETGNCWTKFSPMGDFKVIGNIHDNPELLK